VPRLKTDSKYTRIPEILLHSTRYSFNGRSKLAKDSGCSPRTISRLLRGGSCPTYETVVRVTEALERDLGRPLDVRDVVTFTGTYPTKTVCALVECPGCLPPEAWGDDDLLRPEWQHVRPGEWLTEPERRHSQAVIEEEL